MCGTSETARSFLNLLKYLYRKRICAFGIPVAPVWCNEAHMDNTKQSVQDGFDRFQRLLFAMSAGDELRPCDASLVCGLSEDTCRTVLKGLERAGMMTHQRGDRFVRKTLDLQAAQAIGSGS